MPPAAALTPDSVLERYSVEAVLGEGGMAVVYRVRHRQLGSVHALKVLSLAAPSLRDRLVQEGRVQASLRHPNIVSVTDIIDVAGAPGLIMELVEGPNLEALLEGYRPTVEEAEALGAGILRGVAAAHKIGLIHRDLKPANVLIALSDAGPVPKVADFGLARLLGGEGPSGMRVTRSGQAMGTPSYMAPEQIRNAKGVDKRADIFSLGAILYDLACGAQAFPGDDILTVFTAITSGRFVDPLTVAPDLPPRMVEAIRGALQVDPDQRIADCEVLLALWTGGAASAGAPITRSGGTWSPGLMSTLSNPPKPEPDAPSNSGQTFAVGSLAPLAPSVAPLPPAEAQPVARSHPAISLVQSRPPTPPSTTVPPTTVPPSEPRSGLPVLMLTGGVFGVVVVLGLVLAAIGLAVALRSPDPGVTVTTALPAEVPPDAPIAPIPGVQRPELAGAPATAPAPSAPAATPSPASAAVAAAPPAADTPLALPPPTTVALAIPVESAAPVAAPAAAPEPAVVVAPSAQPDPSTFGTVTFTGNKVGPVYLFAGSKHHPAGRVPAGDYTVEASFNGATAVAAGTIRVIAGETVNLQCNAMFEKCTVK